MTLKDYIQQMLPVLKPTLSRSCLYQYRVSVDRVCEWLGRDVELHDMSPHVIERFRTVDAISAGALGRLMRTHDPMKYPQKCRRTPKPKKHPCSQAQFYLSNVYSKRYEPTALRSRRPNTKRLYRSTLAAFDRYLKRDATLDDLTDETVSAFACWRLADGLSKHSVNKDLFNLLALWRWCHRKGIVELWPDVELETPPRRQPVAWMQAEIKKLYAVALQLEGFVGKHRECDWWPALFLMIWDSGERIGAVMGLDWSNVDLKRGWVRFVAEDRKGGKDDSAVRLSEDTIAALKKIGPADGPVFPWPLSFTYLWVRLSKILKKAGLPSDCKSKFHRIRKTVASYAEAAGGNATAMLRHSKREVTEAYLDPRIVKQQQPADVLFRLQ